MASVQDLAKEMAAQFIQGKRDNGDTYWHLKDESPQWMRDAICAAHGDLMPEDFRYEMVRDCVEVLTEESDEDAARNAVQEQSIPVYNAELTAWLASSIHRPGYCDEAIEEGIVDGRDIMATIVAGYARELDETFALLFQALQEHAETIDNE